MGFSLLSLPKTELNFIISFVPTGLLVPTVWTSLLCRLWHLHSRLSSQLPWLHRGPTRGGLGAYVTVFNVTWFVTKGRTLCLWFSLKYVVFNSLRRDRIPRKEDFDFGQVIFLLPWTISATTCFNWRGFKSNRKLSLPFLVVNSWKKCPPDLPNNWRHARPV